MGTLRSHLPQKVGSQWALPPKHILLVTEFWNFASQVSMTGEPPRYRRIQNNV